MPYRKVPFVTGEVYHLFNRSIARQPVFKNIREYERFTNLIKYYRLGKLPLRFSHFNRLSKEEKGKFAEKHISVSRPTIEILAYCIMPNHFHFLVKQLTSNAISTFLRKIQNGYSKYFNIKYERSGSLFQFMFKGVRIETDEQLVHVSRYIHLNPVTAYIIEQNNLLAYKWSSFHSYVSRGKEDFINSELVLSQFKSPKDYEIFVYDQVGYQRELDKIKHLIHG